MNLTEGATLTGGSTVAYTPAGSKPGGVSYVRSTHTMAHPQRLQITARVEGESKTSLGTARGGVQFVFADRQASEEGCCSLASGVVQLDMGTRWDLSQPESVVNEVIAAVRAFVYTNEFAALFKKGILPTI